MGYVQIFKLNCYRLTHITRHDRIDQMKALAKFLEYIGIKKKAKKIREPYQQDLVFQAGREQFKALLQRGLNVPVVKAL